MPTPFYHLSVAEELLAHPGLQRRAPGLAGLLLRQRGEFLLGNTAADVQVLSGQTRLETHFYDLPIHPGSIPPWEALLKVHPALGTPGKLPAEQAAFAAGYLCHLLADWNWVVEIFTPVFGPEAAWGEFSQRLYLHNVLRSYLDFKIYPLLVGRAAGALSQAGPRSWLPFVQDEHLRACRDWLVEQLQPDAELQTVTVFAARQGLSPKQFHELLGSEERMRQEVFAFLPPAALQVYHHKLVEQSLDLLQLYSTGMPWRQPGRRAHSREPLLPEGGWWRTA